MVAKGFFGMTRYTKKPSRKLSIAGCGTCKLNKSCKSPKMKPTGRGKKGILIIGECPSKREDLRGNMFTGDGGEILRDVLSANGINLERDCLKTNAIRCHASKEDLQTKTGADRTAKVIELCRPNIRTVIKEFQPKMVLLLGGIAIRSVIGDSYHKKIDGVRKWRGISIPDKTYGTWLCPTYHPVYLLRNNQEQHERAFERDIREALKCLDRDFPEYPDDNDSVEVLVKRNEIRDYLRHLNRRAPILTAFDYEGTGLKPHAQGHDLLTAAIAESVDKSVAFPLLPEIRPLFVKYLRNPKINKIAAGMKFESAWSKVILKSDVKSWFFDTMLGAHCLDNRTGVTSLKFQTYVRFGVGDYDSHIEPFLKSKDDKSANAINSIRKAPLREILKYNGNDSLYEFRLALLQLAEMGIADPEAMLRERRHNGCSGK